MSNHEAQPADFAVESRPTVAEQVFGEAIEAAQTYADLLVRDADLLGLLGPREMPKLWSRHILNSAVVAELLPQNATVADIGAGAGLPGLPMALARPDAHFTLIEPMERRATWLADVAVPALGLTNVTVLRARAEEVGQHDFDVVTARAVSALPKLLRMCVPLTKNGGQILALKGSKAADEIAESQPMAKRMKIASFEIVTAGEQLLADPTTVVRIRLI